MPYVMYFLMEVVKLKRVDFTIAPMLSGIVALRSQRLRSSFLKQANPLYRISPTVQSCNLYLRGASAYR